MAVFREITVGQESQSTIDKHCLLRPFTVFSAPVSAPKSDFPTTWIYYCIVKWETVYEAEGSVGQRNWHTQK